MSVADTGHFLCRLDPAHPFPYLPSGSLNIAVELRDPADVSNETCGMCAIVNIPSSLPKWIEVPPGYGATCASCSMREHRAAWHCRPRVSEPRMSIEVPPGEGVTCAPISGMFCPLSDRYSSPCCRHCCTLRCKPSSPRVCRGRETWQHGFVPLEEIITRNLDCLFAGMAIESAHTFRVTRNAELDRQEDDVEDLLDMIADEVRACALVIGHRKRQR